MSPGCIHYLAWLWGNRSGPLTQYWRDHDLAQQKKRDAPLSNAEKQRRHREKKAKELADLYAKVRQLNLELEGAAVLREEDLREIQDLKSRNAELRDLLASATSRR